MKLEPTYRQYTERDRMHDRLRDARISARRLKESLDGIHGDSQGLFDENRRKRVDDACALLAKAFDILF